MINENILKMINELKEDNRSGANELIMKALDIIKKQLNLISEPNKDIKPLIFELSSYIINSRPSMAPLINTIGYIINDIRSFTKEKLLLRIEQFYSIKEKCEKSIKEHFKTFLNNYPKKELKILLISYSSTIINLLKASKEHDLEIYILESRPLLEGRHTAEILSSHFNTHLIIDASMGFYIGEIDIVLLGIDSILRDGAIINKIGSYPLAVLALENDVEVFAVGESLKYNLKSHYGKAIEIEKKPSEEVYDELIKDEKLIVHNYYFDITPPKYISRIISDLGILSIQDFLTKITEILPMNWFQSFLS